VGLQSLAVLLDRPIGDSALRALRAHLSTLPPDVRVWAVRITSRSTREGGLPDPRWQDELAAVADALGHEGTAERRTIVGTFDAAARSLDDGSTLLVVLDGAGAQWALRHARGSTLILPAEAPARPGRPRALLVARDAAEAERLTSWAALLAPDVEVALRGVFQPTSHASSRVLYDLTALEVALETARARLVAAGRFVVAGCVVHEDPPEEEATLVVRVARRGLLRRLLPGPDARACRRRPCARLLLAP
jgi:hypothetical protein